MNTPLNRRDFLKLTSLLPGVLALPPSIRQPVDPEAFNIIVLVFDAWSAANCSLYGYPRQTTPYLDQLVDKALVYHNHYAGGHFTIPGTASLLTGAHPWRHQMVRSNRRLAHVYRQTNLFGLFPDHYRFGYSHNPLAEIILRQMIEQLDELKPRRELYKQFEPASRLFPTDDDISSVSWIRTMEINQDGFGNSLFFSRLWKYLIDRQTERLAKEYPLGIPSYSDSYTFLLEDATDWLIAAATEFASPYLVYFHLLPPHAPYNTRIEHFERFAEDGFQALRKPKNFLSEDLTEGDLAQPRQRYDEFILYVDAEIQRLFQHLEASGQLDKTWVVLTSDHGEMFERGLLRHEVAAGYEPLNRIPLVIFPPGQTERVDIHTPTSAVDIIPTLLAASGKPIPENLEGQVLPPFNLSYPEDRPIYVVDAKYSEPGKAYQTASFMLRQGSYKLIHHFGTKQEYKPLNGRSVSELYDLENDPDELLDLAGSRPELAERMLSDLREKMKQEGVS